MGELNPVKMGLTLGIVCGLYVLFIGLTSALFDWGTAIVDLISSLYIGYSSTLIGSFIGLIWGFIDGFVFGFLLIFIYNKLNKE
jgi:hypothetical protein